MKWQWLGYFHRKPTLANHRRYKKLPAHSLVSFIGYSRPVNALYRADGNGSLLDFSTRKQYHKGMQGQPIAG
jgi:hypothetical protein